MHKETCRGDIWYVDWSPGRGSEQTGLRPAVIIQTDAANSNSRYPNTIVLTISTKGKAVPFHVPLTPSEANGLKQKSYVKCEQISTISKDRLISRLGCLDNEQMEEITAAIRRVIDSG